MQIERSVESHSSESLSSVPAHVHPSVWQTRSLPTAEDSEEDIMDIYLREVGRLERMSDAEEKAIFARIERYSKRLEKLRRKLEVLFGEESARPLEELRERVKRLPESQRVRALMVLERAVQYRDQIVHLRHRVVKANLRLAICVAKKYQNQGLSLPDLIQEANTGLMHAAEKFDYHRGVPFGTYAAWWVQQAVVHALANQGRTIRLPVYVVEMLRRVRRIREQFVREHQREPEADELAALADVPPALTQQLPYLMTQTVPLDKPLDARSSRTLAHILVDPETPSPEERVCEQQMREDIARALRSLPEREARILRLRYGFEDGINHSLQDIGEMLNLSRERIRQLEKRALETLRRPQHATSLREYLYA